MSEIDDYHIYRAEDEKDKRIAELEKVVEIAIDSCSLSEKDESILVNALNEVDV